MKLKNIHLVVFILIVAAVLRLFNLSEIPFTHDEFSALFRLDFDNFSDLIAYGVRIDGHPAGIHVFLYYWVNLFGMAEWIVKLPFIVAGIASVWLIYRIGEIWKNETVGLIAASLMTVSQFTVMYSQIARPYISGLFFSLLMVLYLSKLIKQPDQRVYRNLLGFVIGAALCTYNHHFSMLFAVIVGISGLFLLPKRLLMRYLICGLIVFILYIPHLEILMYQMSMGGVEGWLSKPSDYFLWQFIAFMFNYAWWFILLIATLIAYGWLSQSERPKVSFYVLFGIFFFLPFLIGFFYSKYVNAVLQFSVLIFSAPYLYFLLFGHFREHKVRKNAILVFTILLFGGMSLIVERQHYSVFYQDLYSQSLLDAKPILGKDPEVPVIVNARKDIIKYYKEKQGVEKDFFWLDDFGSKRALKDYLQTISSTQNQIYLSLDYSTAPEIVPVLQGFYPNVSMLKQYHNGSNYLFTKNNDSQEEKRELISSLNFQTQSVDERWSHIDTSHLRNGKLQVDDQMEWTPAFTTNLEEIIESKNDFIDVCVVMDSKEEVNGAFVVVQIINEQEKNHWKGVPIKLKNESVSTYASLKLSDIKTPLEGKLKVYIWNKEKEKFSIDDIKIYVRPGNPLLYGLFNPIE